MWWITVRKCKYMNMCLKGVLMERCRVQWGFIKIMDLIKIKLGNQKQFVSNQTLLTIYDHYKAKR